MKKKIALRLSYIIGIVTSLLIAGCNPYPVRIKSIKQIEITHSPLLKGYTRLDLTNLGMTEKTASPESVVVSVIKHRVMIKDALEISIPLFAEYYCEHSAIEYPSDIKPDYTLTITCKDIKWWAKYNLGLMSGRANLIYNIELQFDLNDSNQNNILRFLETGEHAVVVKEGVSPVNHVESAENALRSALTLGFEHLVRSPQTKNITIPRSVFMKQHNSN